MGKLNVIFGPMYSGKSTELLRIHNKYKIKYEILVINHKSDNRYGNNSICTHNNDSLNCISLMNLSEYYNLLDENMRFISFSPRGWNDAFDILSGVKPYPNGTDIKRD